MGTAITIASAAETPRPEPDPTSNPAAYPAAIVTAGQARFTLLTPAMIRIEWSPTSGFEDRASFAFTNRRLPVPKFSSSIVDGQLTIVTDELTLRYKIDGGLFKKDNLSIELDKKGTGNREQGTEKQKVVWTPGTDEEGNLRGTIRTLDGVSGACPLEPGLLSRDGWVLVDDSQRLLFDSNPQSAIQNPQSPDWPWAASRQSLPPRTDESGTKESPSENPQSAIQNPQSIDWYFLGYGRDYKRALADFTKVAGRIPLPPRFAFGSWWSRYWAYSDEELRTLVAEFRAHDVPLDVLVIDMDWHLDGWTGYTWNPKYFPDPDGFLKWVRGEGLRATLNLHPADGVKKHEAAFPDFARAMGLDPDKVDQVPFDSTDRQYVENYFKLLHHPLEKQGIDFWWIDWQQGKKAKIEGLDPLFWLNYLHWTDMERDLARRGGKRPILFSRWGGLGNHRYQIGFSGDTFSNWASLAFQPYFTATAGNVGYAYWSHDIGGHQPGVVEPELYARWIQFGALSPALRTHTTKNPKAERRIWEFPDEVFQAARKAFHLRYELIPYIYTMARKCYDTGLPLCRPLYYEWPELDEAYTHGGQYLFGDDLLVAPVAQPMSPLSGTAEVDVWIPPGEWTSWFTGRTYTGPTMATLMVPLDEIPLFVKSGGIIPAQPKMSRSGEKPVDPLILHIFPGASGETRVYEDDGETVGYQKNECAWTPVSVRVDADSTRHITIGPTEGEFAGMLRRRQYEIHVNDVWPAKEVIVNGDKIARLGIAWPRANLMINGGNEVPLETVDREGWSYDVDEMSLVVLLPPKNADEQTTILVRPDERQVDVTLLRKGLRGALNLLDIVPRVLTGTVCKDSPRLLLLAEEAHKDDEADEATAEIPKTTLEAAKQLVDGWDGQVTRVWLSDSTELRLGILMRLLGLSSRVACTPDPDAPGRLVAKLRLVPIVPFVDLAHLAGDIRLSTDPPWSLEGESRSEVKGLQENKSFVLETRLASDSPLSTGRLRATFALKLKNQTIDVPLDVCFLPSVNQWWILGPFDCPFETKGLDCVFPPEEKIDLAATYNGKNGQKIRWKEAKRPLTPGADLTDEFFVHLHDFYGERHQNAIAYALAYLHAPRAMDASLAIGSDDGVAVWLNGKEVHRSTVGRPYSPKQDRVPVRLNEGVNTLLLKISQGGGDWGFGVHVETPDGKPLPEVQARLTPEPQAENPK